jgi:uncharacterized protein (TIGR03435 family)
LVCGCLSIANAQAGQTPEFDVASLKPSPPPENRFPPRMAGGPGTEDRTRISYRSVPLAMLIAEGYGVDAPGYVVGPAWATTWDLRNDKDRYNIEAKLPAQTSKEQFRSMLRNLLADRFALKLHREKRAAPVFALVLAKNGPKIKESPPAAVDANSEQKLDLHVRGEDGFPVTPPGYSGLFVRATSGHTRVKFIRYSMDQFAKWTSVNSKRPGVDRTGLTGRYDFYLEFGNDIGVPKTVEGSAPQTVDQGETFSAAVQSQLGLRLVPETAEIELLVIDHIERVPSAN